MSVTVEMTGDEAKLWASLMKVQKATKSVEKAGEQAGKKYRKAGKHADKAFGAQAVGKLTAYAASLVGVSTIVSRITQSYNIQLATIKEISDESRKAANQMIAFAALQEGGTKAQRVQSAAQLAARFGITDRGEAFNTVQALQSALGGDFEAGMKAAAEVFAATQVGVSLASATEVAALGIAQGQGGPEALRRAFVAGEESSRSPEVIATGARGLSFFEDKVTGFAAAGVLAGGVGQSELVTYVQAAGKALSDVGALAELYKKLGVLGSTELQKLTAMRDAGIDTVEELSRAGLGELRQQKALSLIIPNLDDLVRIAGAIETKAQPGLLASKRLGIEEEIPLARTQREQDILEAMMRDEMAFGPRATRAQRDELNARRMGLALRRMGIESAFGRDIIDEQGRTTIFDMALLNIQKEFTGDRAPFARELIAELKRIDRELAAATVQMGKAADAMQQVGERSSEPLSP